jgi:TetR/AcrR family transcriptional regulator
MATRAPEKLRDAERSREAILTAAERLFAEHGYDRTSLNDIAADAGLSRGTPSYFFGSKEHLYGEVITRTFAAREAATRAAFEPVRAWAADGGGPDALRAALTTAAEGYMGFLTKRPSFVKLVMREELSGRAPGRGNRKRGTAIEDAFDAVHLVGRDRGLRPFSVDDAVLLFVALTFAPLSYSETWMRAAGRDLRTRPGREQQAELAVTLLMNLLVG